MKGKIINYRIKKLKSGQKFVFTRTICEADADRFIVLSKDINPLHVNEDFARSRGFSGRVVHGAFIISCFLKLIGVHLPGRNCLLQTLDVKFLAPVYINDTIEILGEIDRVLLGTNVVVLNIAVKNAKNNIILLKGKIQVGFTRAGR
jgi:3-hydroxybutyryl-CoA dehydratase